MSYVPTAVAASLLPILKKKGLGGEKRIKISDKPTVYLGSFTISGADAGTWEPDAAGMALLSAVPADVVAILETNVFGGAEDVVLNLTGKDNTTPTPADLTGVATLKIPTWSKLQRKNMPAGYATDVVPGTPTKPFKIITAVTVECAADAANAIIRLYAVVPLSDFQTLGCIGDANLTTKGRKPTAIACGLDDGAEIKPGKRPVGNFEVGAKYSSVIEGLSRYDGVPCSLVVEIVKEDRVMVERWLLIDFTPGVSIKAPESEGAMTEDSAGLYAFVGFFVAQTAA